MYIINVQINRIKGNYNQDEFNWLHLHAEYGLYNYGVTQLSNM